MAAKKTKKSAPAKPAKKAAKKPVAKKPAAKKPAAKPAKPAKKVSKPAAKPVAKAVAKPVAKKPEHKPVAKPEPKVVAKPVEKKPIPKVIKEVPVAKKGVTSSKKIPLPSRVIKKDPIVVTHSPESQELIKKTIEPRIAREQAKADAKVEVKREDKPVLPPVEKKMMEKKPMIVKNNAHGEPEEEKRFYNKEELEEFRQIINEKMTEAKEEYKRLVESLQETNEMSADGYNMTEFGSDTIDKEQTEMFLARQKKFMNNLERALVRIENGTYGRCKVTGKLIPKERLRLVPHTESSIEAKQQQYDKPSVSIDEF
jgi:RNA polymerase-binding protein DksA